MFNFKQLESLMKLIVSSICVFIFISTIMWASTIISPSFIWAPKQFFGVDFVKDNYQRVQATVAHYQNNLEEKDESLVVILGLSSASEGIEIVELQKMIKSEKRVLSLSGAGRNMKEISLYASPLIESSINPGLVVFAINPFHLMDPPIKKRKLTSAFQEAYKNPFLVIGWFLLKRDDIKHIIEMNILKLRTNLFKLLKNNGNENSLSPWRESIRMGLYQLSTKQQWDTNLTRYRDRGYYNLENYMNTHSQITEFAMLLSVLHDKGSEVVVVLMPEHSSLNQRIPAEAMDILQKKLNFQLQEEVSPLFLDYRKSVNDVGFRDISHMNRVGREKFTRLLGEYFLNKINY